MNTVSNTQQKQWHLLALFGFGIVFISVLLWLLFLRPAISQAQCYLVRIVLALAAAGIGAIIPGTISANAPGVAKAGGAAAFFVIVLAVYSCPADPRPVQPEKSSAPNPELSPPVITPKP